MSDDEAAEVAKAIVRINTSLNEIWVEGLQRGE
jgi:hypothetical protein